MPKIINDTVIWYSSDEQELWWNIAVLHNDPDIHCWGIDFSPETKEKYMAAWRYKDSEYKAQYIFTKYIKLFRDIFEL